LHAAGFILKVLYNESTLKKPLSWMPGNAPQDQSGKSRSYPFASEEPGNKPVSEMLRDSTGNVYWHCLPGHWPLYVYI